MPQREPTPLEMIGMLSGDPVINRAVQAGRPPKGGARKSIGQGFFYDPETDSVARDPVYEDWEKEKRARDIAREKELYERGLREPDYRTQQTPEGVTVYDINPRNEPSPYQVPMEAERPDPKDATKASKYERSIEQLLSLKENLPPGVGALGKETVLGIVETVVPESLEPVARNAALDLLYTKEEQDAIRTLSRTFAATVKEFAGAAQTKTETANVKKFAPHSAMTHQQLLDTIDEFIVYVSGEAAAIRDPYGRSTPTQVAPTPTPPAPVSTSAVSEQSDEAILRELEELRQSQGAL